tara:strand:- start:509 stop:2395 length:1887 start_codon:yes stop_codon:yes gene_type:complete
MLSKVFIKLLKKNAPRWLVLVIDVYIVLNTFVLSYLIRFDFSISFDTSKFMLQLPVVIIFSLLSFIIVGSYKGIIRHTGIKDSLNVLVANLLLFGLLVGAVMLSNQFKLMPDLTIPRSILVIHFLLNVFVLIASRFLYKWLYTLFMSETEIDNRVLIYGAGEAGMLVYSVLNDTKNNKIQIIGFLDDDKRKIGNKVNGIPVYNPNKITEAFILKKNIDEIIMSIQNIKPSRLLEIVGKVSKLPLKVKIVPPIQSWINGDFNAKQIKSVKIEDLLGRIPIELNNPILHKEFNDKIILVTGAAGSIGSEIARQLASFNYKQLILIDQAESELYNLQQYFVNKNKTNIKLIVADIQNKDRLNVIFQKFKPNIVFHAAAYKHVPFMEENPYEAVRTNVLGTKNIADVAIENKVEKVVVISTDKAVNPTNVMGASKRIAEIYINCLTNKGITKFSTTRFGNVLGSNGSVIPLFQNQIANGGPLTVTHKEITRYFMTIPEACQLVLEAGSMGKGGEIFVFDMGNSIKIFDLALNMIRLSGLKYPSDIDIKITGLRPGEKIYEELLGDKENTIATHHEKIMIAKVAILKTESIKKQIEDLCRVNNEINYAQTVLKMKQIVPEFISNNSKYEELDK